MSTSSGKEYPKAYLFLAVLTLVVSTVGTYVATFSLRPEQEKLKLETEKVGDEIDAIRQQTKKTEYEINAMQLAEREAEPRISLSYLYTNPTSEQETKGKFDPRAGFKTYLLPKVKVPGLYKKLPSRDSWPKLPVAPGCDCDYFRDWLSTNSNQRYSERVLPVTLYLIMLSAGKTRAEDIVLEVDRVELQHIVGHDYLFSKTTPLSELGNFKHIRIKLNTLDPGSGLRVPVADLARATDAMGDGLTPEIDFPYGVAYVPRSLSYLDVTQGKRVRIPVRVPEDLPIDRGGSIQEAG